MVADDAKTTLTIPTFNGQHYTRWKKLVDLWRKATNVAEEKQGPVLILNMSGKAQDIALNLPNTNLENVLKEMEAVYGDSMELVTRYEEFDAFNRTTD